MNNNYKKAYAIQRGKDESLEKMCANYVDTNWFGKIKNKYERVTDCQRQIKGEDVVIFDANNKPKYIIDEKAKLAGCVNCILNYPSFELVCRNRNGDWFDGWFAKVKTHHSTHYGFISVAANKDVETNQESTLTYDNIDAVLYGMIPCKKLAYWVEKQTGKTIEEITKDAWELKRQYEIDPDQFNNGKYLNVVKDYKSDGLGRYIYLKMSPNRREQPVNLVIRRDYLRNEGLIAEVYVDDEKIMKFNPPPFGSLNKSGDIFTRM